MKEEKFYRCPKCESKATYRVRASVVLFILGSILSIFIITAIIGIPLILLSPIAYIIERVIGKEYYMCRSCKHNFTIDIKKEAKGE